MNLIDNYVSVVVRFIKKDEEIKKEVRELIYSMLEDKYGYKEVYSDEEVSVVLKELGNPNLLAIKYSNLPKTLVSEKYTTQFYYILAIVLIVVSILNLFSVLFETIESPRYFFSIIMEFLFSTVTSLFGAFGILTFIFILLERNNKEVNIDKNFNPMTLKDSIKVDKVKSQFRYKRSELIVNIIFSIVAIIGLTLFIDQIPVYINGEKILLVNMDYWDSIIVFVDLLILSSIIKDILLLIFPDKNIKSLTIVFIYEVICSIASTFIFATTKILNKDIIDFFVEEGIFTGNGFNFSFPQAIMSIIGVYIVVITIIYIVNLSKVLLFKKSK